MKNPIKIIANYIHGYSEKEKYQALLVEIARYLHDKGAKVLYVEPPMEYKIKGLTDFEKERIDNWSFDLNRYREELPKLKRLYGEDVTQEYILSVFDGGVVTQGEKRKVLLDFQSENQHIVNGYRITTDQPSRYHHHIYTCGACTWRGTGVEDRETIASYVQKHINTVYPDSYKVINLAIGRGSSLFDDFERLKEENINKGDIVILGPFGPSNRLKSGLFRQLDIHHIETSSLFHRPHTYGEWFNDHPLHTNKRGNKVIGEYIYHTLESLHWLTGEGENINVCQENPLEVENLTTGQKIYGDNPELMKYVDSLRQYQRGDSRSMTGGIVMNCNPFTLGHRYLIEYASSQVDWLYIFVVEENKSYFSFEDRLKLVRLGTADLKNVIVLPGGNFIISAVTFPGYFYKDNLRDVKIDCSNDLNVFAQYIAPALNIRIRFAGEEPLDPVTNQYNEGMREILPKYGIQFIAIPRKEDGEEVISASRVRRYFESGRLDCIRPIVPLTTYRYLEERYNLEHI